MINNINSENFYNFYLKYRKKIPNNENKNFIENKKRKFLKIYF